MKRNYARLLKGSLILCSACVIACVIIYLYFAYTYYKGLKSEINRYYDTFMEWSFNGKVSEISEYGLKIEGVSNKKDINIIGQEFIPPVSVNISDIQPDGESVMNLKFMPDDSTTMFKVGDSVLKQANTPVIKIGELNIIVSEDNWKIDRGK